MEKVACRALKGLGNLHWIAVGFSMISFALERIRQVSSNFEKCVDLLDTMFGLAKCLAEQHRRIPTETESINKAVLAIVDGVITCCSCMTQEKLFKYMFASTDDENLKRIEGVIEKVRWQLSLIMTADLQRQIPRRQFEFKYTRPVDAVGIDNRVREVIELLDMQNKGQRRAVILRGFGGIGKTTLADCVMSELDLAGFKHSRIQLDEKQSDMKSYQENICAQLTKETPRFNDCIEGKQKLQEIVERESIFVFIDNALIKDQLNDLLPSDLSLAVEIRMLITTRDARVADALRIRSIDCKEYLVEELPREVAKNVFRELVLRCDPTKAAVGNIGLAKIDAVAEQCHGVPLLLRVYAPYLARHGSDPEAYDEMLAELRKGDFSYSGEKNVGEKLLYVYHQLREQDKDAFIDVCTYFHGWSKKTVSYILKQREFNALVDGGLVNIDSSDHVVVHDVLRAMGIKLGEDSRVRGDDDWERVLARKKEFKGIWLLRDKTEARHVFDEFAETQWVVRGGRKSEIDDVLDIERQHLSAARVLAVGGRIRFAGECRVSLPKLRFLRF